MLKVSLVEKVQKVDIVSHSADPHVSEKISVPTLNINKSIK